MNSNQTRFQLLLGRDDWGRCTAPDGTPILGGGDGSALFSWRNARSELTLGTRVNVFHSSSGNRVPTAGQRRGAAADRFGNIYWISDSQTEILVRSSGTSSTDHFWSSTDEVHQHVSRLGGFSAHTPPAPSIPLVFSALTVTEEHYLVVGTVQPAGLMIFDLFRGGPPRCMLWPSEIPFAPFEMAAAVGGGIWVLDRDNARLWQLDRTFAIVSSNQGEINLPHAPEDFAPLDGTPQPLCRLRYFPAGVSLHSASPLRLIDPCSLTVIPDNSVLLLESNPANRFSLVHRLRDGLEIGDPVSLDSLLNLLEPDDQPGFELLGFDFVFIANEQTSFGSRQDTLYVVGQNGEQAWAFTIDYSTDQLLLTPLPEYYPMRLFGGCGLIAGPNQVFYDSQQNWVPLVIQKRPRFVEEATLLTFIWDGKQPDCVWDRLMLDAAIPAETAVTIYSRAGNDSNLLQAQDWNLEPSLHMRGDGTELPWTPEPAGEATWELLFQYAVGQYLQLKLVLTGNRQLTPRLRALRAYYPRFSYLEHYLPGVYRDDPQSASFLDRLLCNFEGFYTSIEDRIAAVQALFDAVSAPSDALDWLANWFGVALDPSWSDAKRRLFISNATTFFEARGTLSGLMMALRLAVEDCADQSIFTAPVSQQGIRLVEKYQKRRLPPGIRQPASATSGLVSTSPTTAWTPALGADELNRRYAAAVPGQKVYPIVASPTDPQYQQWTAFSTANLGLVPTSPDTSSLLWPIFLGGRYRSITDLNNAYGAAYSDFTAVPFPAQLPRASKPLWDWYQFQGIELIDAAAHQFTVLLPLLPADAQNTAVQRSKLELVQRVVDLEKPAHTAYDIQFYWAFFRLGDARLGLDTVLGSGSRAPQLMLPALLGDSYVGSTYLSRQPRPRPFLKKGSC